MWTLRQLVVIGILAAAFLVLLVVVILTDPKAGQRKPRARSRFPRRFRRRKAATAAAASPIAEPVVTTGAGPIGVTDPAPGSASYLRRGPQLQPSAHVSFSGTKSSRLLDPPPPGPNGPAPEPAATPPLHAAVSTVETALAPEQAVAPRFVPGSRASRMPWRLPFESASPPGVAADQACLGNLEVRAASVIGAGHRCEEPVKPRQDAYRVARDRTGEHLVVAVADGMSDSARSELGASVAVATAVALLRRHLDDGRPAAGLQATQLFGDVSAALVQAARDRNLDPADVRTTLAVAVLPAYGGTERVVPGWGAQIADTHLWRLNDAGWCCLTGTTKDNFDGSALDAFLPHRPEAARGFAFDLAEGDTLAVLSDGVADAFSEVAGAVDWFAERWRRPPPLASFVLDVDFEAKGLQDDRTAVVVWAGPPAAAGGARRR